MLDTETPSPRWTPLTKLLVAAIFIVLLGATAARFQFLIIPLISAAMIAYLLHPLITLLTRELRWPRGLASGLIYLFIISLVILLATGAGLYAITQISSFNLDLQQIIIDLPKRLDELIHSQFDLFGFKIDLRQFDFSPIYSQIVNAIQPAISQAGSQLGTAASNTAEFLGWLFFVMLISFYIVNDMPNFSSRVQRVAADPGYEMDVRRLLRETQKVWNAFLRGQLILAISNAILTALILTAIGLRYSFIIGLISGMLNFVPYIGPIVITSLSVGVALFQPGNWLGLGTLPFVGVVLLALFICQQITDYGLSPRIVGRHLELHPAVILVGAIMGATLGGFIGLILAAPILATLKVLGRYVWRKMLDQPPFEEEVESRHAPLFDVNIWLVRLRLRRAPPAPPPPLAPDEKAMPEEPS